MNVNVNDNLPIICIRFLFRNVFDDTEPYYMGTNQYIEKTRTLNVIANNLQRWVGHTNTFHFQIKMIQTH